MATRNQIEANIQNSKSSTGPRTEEGKNASKANAVQHGLASEELVQVGAREHFEEIYDDLCDVFGNTNAAKRILIQKMANAIIRERDCEEVEFFLLEYAAAEDAGQPLTVPEPGTNQATAFSFLKRMNLEKALHLVHRYKTAAQREFSRNHADAMRAVAYTYRVHAEQAKRRNAAARQALTGPLPDFCYADSLQRRSKPKAPASTTEIKR